APRLDGRADRPGLAPRRSHRQRDHRRPGGPAAVRGDPRRGGRADQPRTPGRMARAPPAPGPYPPDGGGQRPPFPPAPAPPAPPPKSAPLRPALGDTAACSAGDADTGGPPAADVAEDETASYDAIASAASVPGVQPDELPSFSSPVVGGDDGAAMDHSLGSLR